jgi:hypothetical protein
MSESITIKDVRTYAISKEGGGDYHLQEKGHCITDTYLQINISPRFFYV